MSDIFEQRQPSSTLDTRMRRFNWNIQLYKYRYQSHFKLSKIFQKTKSKQSFYFLLVSLMRICSVKYDTADQLLYYLIKTSNYIYR